MAVNPSEEVVELLLNAIENNIEYVRAWEFFIAACLHNLCIKVGREYWLMDYLTVNYSSASSHVVTAFKGY